MYFGYFDCVTVFIIYVLTKLTFDEDDNFLLAIPFTGAERAEEGIDFLPFTTSRFFILNVWFT